MNVLRPSASRIVLVVTLLTLPASLAAQAPTADGYWRLVQVKSEPTRIPPHDCYPFTVSGGETSGTMSSQSVCQDPPGAFSMTGTWSRPPEVLVPGTQVPLWVDGRITTHDARLFQGGGVEISINAVPCGGAYLRDIGAQIALSNQDPARMALRQEGSVEIPGNGWGHEVPELGGRLQIMACTTGWASYFLYAWQPGSPPATRSVWAEELGPPSGVEHLDVTFGFMDPFFFCKKFGCDGRVEWKPGPDDAWREARGGETLPEYAHVRTTAGAWTWINLGDIRLRVGESSEVILYPRTTQRYRARIKVLQGEVLDLHPPSTTGDSFEIEMVQTMVVVKGTLLTASSRSGTEELTVCEGAAVATHTASGQVMDVGAGERVVATASGLRRSAAGAAICDEYHALADPSGTGGPPARDGADLQPGPNRLTFNTSNYARIEGAAPGTTSFPGVFANPDAVDRPNAVEFDFAISSPCSCRLDIEYAAAASRPVEIYLDGRLVAANALGATTGGWHPGDQRWSRGITVLDVAAGRHALRIARGSVFPHIRSVELVRVGPGVSQGAGGAGTETVQTGTLAAGDLQLQSGEYYDEYKLEAGAGEKIVVTLTSYDFDPYLIAIDPSGDQTENDDYENSREISRVEVPVGNRPGIWKVRVTSYQKGETGDYTLTMESRPAE